MKITRRSAVLGLGALAIGETLLRPRHAAAQTVYARHGLNGYQYQAEFNRMAAQGYRLVHVMGYGIGGTAYYAAIWEQRDGPPQIARHGLNPAAYQQAVNDYGARGYRVRRVSGYEAGGVYYAAIWEQTGGPPVIARHGLDSAAYQAYFNQMTNQGYRLVWVCGYPVGGHAYYAAIWEQRGGPPLIARHGLDHGAYQRQFDDAAAQGYRLREVSGYGVHDGPHFAAIWEKDGGASIYARHNIDSAEYQRNFDTMAQRGYRLTDVSGYDGGGRALYAAIWEQG
jgi:Bacterial tandem repeat domain 1